MPYFRARHSLCIGRFAKYSIAHRAMDGDVSPAILHIEGGASWVQTIQVAITDCQVFIPVRSKMYGDTKWTLRELHAADEANKEILPLWHRSA
ncbi:TIR domain-containing protein [Haematococcus lacustris]|uniref:TIR domain-containing protein n=1 Tax=Haematococcus lacustris TaxID=44745 RepID=A0A699YGL2_HAELA|nr:TIR domain-containing protein [Haematococcus lacustris]